MGHVKESPSGLARVCALLLSAKFESSKTFWDNEEATQACNSVASEIRSGKSNLLQAIESIGEQLTDTEDTVRFNAMAALEMLVHDLGLNYFKAHELSVLQQFFSDRLHDRACLPVTIAALNFISTCTESITIGIVQLLESICKAFDEDNRLSLEPSDTRMKVLTLIKSLYSSAAERAPKELDYANIIKSLVGMMNGEKDPRNLMVLFPLLSEVLTDCQLLINNPRDVFDAIFCYFPITFKNGSASQDIDITTKDLKKALADCLTAKAEFSTFFWPAVLEKATASSSAVRMDCFEVCNLSIKRWDYIHNHEWISHYYRCLLTEIENAPETDICEESLKLLTELLCVLGHNTKAESEVANILNSVMRKTAELLSSDQIELYATEGKLFATLVKSLAPRSEPAAHQIISKILTSLQEMEPKRDESRCCALLYFLADVLESLEGIKPLVYDKLQAEGISLLSILLKLSDKQVSWKMEQKLLIVILQFLCLVSNLEDHIMSAISSKVFSAYVDKFGSHTSNFTQAMYKVVRSNQNFIENFLLPLFYQSLKRCLQDEDGIGNIEARKRFARILIFGKPITESSSNYYAVITHIIDELKSVDWSTASDYVSMIFSYMITASTEMTNLDIVGDDIKHRISYVYISLLKLLCEKRPHRLLSDWNIADKVQIFTALLGKFAGNFNDTNVTEAERLVIYQSLEMSVDDFNILLLNSIVTSKTPDALSKLSLDPENVLSLIKSSDTKSPARGRALSQIAANFCNKIGTDLFNQVAKDRLRSLSEQSAAEAQFTCSLIGWNLKSRIMRCDREAFYSVADLVNKLTNELEHSEREKIYEILKIVVHPNRLFCEQFYAIEKRFYRQNLYQCLTRAMKDSLENCKGRTELASIYTILADSMPHSVLSLQIADDFPLFMISLGTVTSIREQIAILNLIKWVAQSHSFVLIPSIDEIISKLMTFLTENRDEQICFVTLDILRIIPKQFSESAYVDHKYEVMLKLRDMLDSSSRPIRERSRMVLHVWYSVEHI